MTVPVAQHDPNATRTVVVEGVIELSGKCHGDIELAIMIEIADSDRIRERWISLQIPLGVYGGEEGPITVAKQDADCVGGAIVDTNDVQLTVAVEIANGNAHRIRPDAEGARRLKCAIAIA
jgi:hypothetical protein